jgi:hypothetical protein
LNVTAAALFDRNQCRLPQHAHGIDVRDDMVAVDVTHGQIARREQSRRAQQLNAVEVVDDAVVIGIATNQSLSTDADGREPQQAGHNRGASDDRSHARPSTLGSCVILPDEFPSAAR